MTGIGAGLAVFGVGSAVSGVGMGLANFTSESGNFAEDIKDKVNTLMSIAVEHPDLVKKSDNVKYALLRIGEGISGFGSENLKSALSNFASGLVEFFTIGGPDPTPLDIAMQVAENGDALQRGADGMVTLARGFTALSRISADNDFDVNPDIIRNLTAFSSEMAMFAGAQFDMSEAFGKYAEGVDKSVMTAGDGVDRTVPILRVANAFQALADSMDNVSESARNLVMPDISSGPELFNLGNGTGGNNIVVNNVNATNTTVGPTIASVGINPEGQQTSNSAVSSD